MKKIKLSVVLFSLAAACTAFGYANCPNCPQGGCPVRMSPADRDMMNMDRDNIRMNRDEIRMNMDDMRMNRDMRMDRRNVDSDRDLYRNRNVHLQVDTDKEMYRDSDSARRNVKRSIQLNKGMESGIDSDMDSDVSSDSSDKMVSLDDRNMNVNRSLNIDTERNLRTDSERMRSDNVRSDSINAPRPASMPADESGTSGDLDRTVNRTIRYDASRNVNAPVVERSIEGFDY